MATLVTGAAGFIGSHVVDRLLEQGGEVVGLDNFDPWYDPAIKEANLERARSRDGFTLIEGDIRDHALVSGLPGTIDSVIHLAARVGVRPSIRESRLYSDVNLMGTSVLLEFARERGIRSFVFASSSSVYGASSRVPFVETDPVARPISPYAATKQAGELLCHTESHLHGMSSVCLRFFTVFGPRQRPDLAIRKFSRLLLGGEEIPRYGDGSTARDYTYVDDIVRGVGAALELARGGEGRFEIVNLGGSRMVSLSEMIREVGEAFGVPPRVRELPMQPGDLERTGADLEKARALLGFEPSTGFEEGLRRFAAWYRETGAAQDGVGIPPRAGRRIGAGPG